MKTINGIEFLKVGEVAKLLNRSPQTIKIWYEYAEKKNIDLPKYITDIDARGSRFWKKDDISKLIEFRDTIEKGMMSEVNVHKWGKRGKEIIEKGTSYGTKRFEKDK